MNSSIEEISEEKICRGSVERVLNSPQSSLGMIVAAQKNLVFGDGRACVVYYGPFSDRDLDFDHDPFDWGCLEIAAALMPWKRLGESLWQFEIEQHVELEDRMAE